MAPEYATICGVTEEELLTHISFGIDDMAEKLGKTREETIRELKKKYDGYHFTWPSPDIYNPYSLVNAFSDRAIKSYWFETGTPRYVVEMMRKFSVRPQDIGEQKASASAFDAPTESMTDIIPLLYQSGYITIKDYNPDTTLYLLDMPNEEVREGLMENLLPNYVSNKTEAYSTINEIGALIRKDDMDGALKKLQKFLLKVPYPDFVKKEKGEDAEEA